MKQFLLVMSMPWLLAIPPAELGFPGFTQAKVKCKICNDPDNPAGTKVCKYCGTSMDYANFPIPSVLALSHNTDQMPCWGPSGQIAFVCHTNGKNIWTMNADGGGKREFDRGQESFGDVNPSWGPNGKIVFEGGASDISIWIMDGDGSNRRVIGVPDSTDRQPSINKDGIIAFASDKGQGGDEWLNIFTMDSNGGNLTKLTKDGTYNYNPCWSPDGTKIVYSTWYDDNQEIQVMNADGTGSKRLTTSPKSDYEPFWAPDGRIDFVSDRDNTNTFKNQMGEIYIMNADGTGQKRLTWNRWTDRNPTMDAKGRLVFQCAPDYGPLKSRGMWSIGMIQVK